MAHTSFFSWWEKHRPAAPSMYGRSNSLDIACPPFNFVCPPFHLACPPYR